MSCSNSRVVPRNGHTLVVGIVLRISGCANQKEVSLEDQVDHGKEVVAEHYHGPDEYRVIATKGKGERLDRPELDQIEGMLRTRELDMLVMEDLGRLIRDRSEWIECGQDLVSLFVIQIDDQNRHQSVGRRLRSQVTIDDLQRAV